MNDVTLQFDGTNIEAYSSNLYKNKKRDIFFSCMLHEIVWKNILSVIGARTRIERLLIREFFYILIHYSLA